MQVAALLSSVPASTTVAQYAAAVCPQVIALLQVVRRTNYAAEARHDSPPTASEDSLALMRGVVRLVVCQFAVPKVLRQRRRPKQEQEQEQQEEGGPQQGSRQEPAQRQSKIPEAAASTAAAKATAAYMSGELLTGMLGPLLLLASSDHVDTRRLSQRCLCTRRNVTHVPKAASETQHSQRCHACRAQRSLRPLGGQQTDANTGMIEAASEVELEACLLDLHTVLLSEGPPPPQALLALLFDDQGPAGAAPSQGDTDTVSPSAAARGSIFGTLLRVFSFGGTSSNLRELTGTE